MEYLALYFVGIIIMLGIQFWVKHSRKQHFKYVIYLTLVLSGAYKFAQYLVAGRGYVYVFFLSIALALFAAYITRTFLGEKPVVSE